MESFIFLRRKLESFWSKSDVSIYETELSLIKDHIHNFLDWITMTTNLEWGKYT